MNPAVCLTLLPICLCAVGGCQVIEAQVSPPAAPERLPEAPSLLLPQRLDHRLPPPRAPQSLPEWAAAVPRVSITYHVKQRSQSLKRISVTRSAKRVLVRTPEEEWFFEQNAADPRRADGQRIIHHRKLILGYSEADLVDAGLGRDWAHLVTLGVGTETLLRMRSVGFAQVNGIQCEAFVASDPTLTLQEVCWNHRGRYPVRLRVGSGDDSQTHIAVEVSENIDEAQTAPPRTRYPDYTLIDLADWREESPSH